MGEMHRAKNVGRGIELNVFSEHAIPCVHQPRNSLKFVLLGLLWKL